MQTIQKKIEQRHRSRIMFGIINNQLHISHPNNSQSHWEWFQDKGWIKDKQDPLFEEIVRGMVNDQGDIYFYSGSDFHITAEKTKYFFRFINELVTTLSIKPTANIYGGLIPQTPGGNQWPAIINYGTVSHFSHNL